MKNLINTILFSILITNASFANTLDHTEQLETVSIVQSQEQPKQAQPDDINQKLQKIEEILKYIALMQIKTEETNQEQPTIENSRTNIQTRTSKAITLIKSIFNNGVGAGKFVIDRINNIMSKKFLIAACLILGPSVYAYTKLKPDVFPDILKVLIKKFTGYGVITGEQVLDGTIEGISNNPLTAAKIAGVAIAGKMTLDSISATSRTTIAPSVAKGIKKGAKYIYNNPKKIVSFGINIATKTGTFIAPLLSTALMHPLVFLSILLPIPIQ